MKTVKINKGTKKILIGIAIIFLLWLSYVYNFFRYGLTTDPEQLKVYFTVCKNIDIAHQKIRYINITSDTIGVDIETRIIPGLIGASIGLDRKFDAYDYDSMYNIYDDLQPFGKDVGVGTGVSGSSYNSYTFDRGALYITKYGWDWGYSPYELFEKAMLRDDVTKISAADCDDIIRLSNISEKLPENTSVTTLCAKSKDTPDISSFKGLRTLKLRITGSKSCDMSILNDLPQLESITVTAPESKNMDFTNTKCSGVRSVIILADGMTDEFESILHNSFPNAEIMLFDEWNEEFREIWIHDAKPR